MKSHVDRLFNVSGMVHSRNGYNRRRIWIRRISQPSRNNARNKRYPEYSQLSYQRTRISPQHINNRSIIKQLTRQATEELKNYDS